MEPTRTFTIFDLAMLGSLSLRTVRYYIQDGLVDRPHGIGKGAYYTQTHVEQILTIRKWQDAGLSLQRIRELMLQGEGAQGPVPPAPRRAGTVEVWSHVVVADGVEVNLEPGRAGLSPQQVRAFVRGVTQVYQQLHESEAKK